MTKNPSSCAPPHLELIGATTLPSDVATWQHLAHTKNSASGSHLSAKETPPATERFIIENEEDEEDDDDDDGDDALDKMPMATDDIEHAQEQARLLVKKENSDDASITFEEDGVCARCEELSRNNASLRSAQEQWLKEADEHAAALRQLNELHRDELARLRLECKAAAERHKEHGDAQAADRVGALGVLRNEVLQLRRDVAAANAAALQAETRADDLRRSLAVAQAAAASARAEQQVAQATVSELRARCDAAEARIRLADERAQIAEAAGAALSVQLCNERQESATTVALVRQQTADTLRRQADEHMLQLDRERAQIATLQAQLNDELRRDSIKRAITNAEEPPTKRATTTTPAAPMIMLVTGFPRTPPETRARAVDALTRLGVTVLDNVGEHEFPANVTHVLNGGGRTTKVMSALLRKVPVIQLEWVEQCIKANALVSPEPYLRRRLTHNADPLLNKTICLTTSFLTSQSDIKNGYVQMAHQLCIAGRARAVIEGDANVGAATSNAPKVDFAIIGENDTSVSARDNQMTFRAFVRLIDQP